MAIYTNLQAAWLFDEGSGTSSADSSGNSRTGTLVGTPSWTTGGLVLVQASGQYSDVTTYVGPSGTGAKSFGVRFKTSNAGVTQYLGGWGTTSVSGSTFALSIESGTIYVSCNGCNCSYGASIADGSTHRILVVIPASATMSQVQLFVDGSERTPTATNGSTALNTDVSAGNVRIGHYWLEAGGTFDGTIYEAYIWTQALSSADQTLFFAGDYPWYAATPTDLTADRIYQRSYGTTAKTITFAGTYDSPTTPSSVEVKIVRAGTSTTVQDWTALSSATISNGSYSGSLSVPSEDYLYNYLARIKDSGDTVLATSSQTSNSWGVGVLFGCTGQSNMEKMFSISSTPPTPDSTVRKYQAGWGAVTGNGGIRLANLLHAIYGCPVGLLNNGINDTGLVYNAGSGIWQSGSSPYDNFLTAISAVGGDLEGVFQHQGEADMKGLTSKAAYKAQLAIEYAGFCAAVTRTTNLLFGIAITGSFQHVSATDASCSAIRDGQMEYALGVGGNVFIAGNSIDMVRDVGDNAHWTAPYYERMAYRYAQSLKQKVGATGYNGNGPRSPRVRKSGGIIKILPNMNYHNSLTELDGSTDGASLTGWEVSDDDFATTLTIDSTEFVGNEIWLHTSGGDATAQHKVRYLYGDEPDITNTVHGNLIPAGDTIGGSMLPVPATVATPERVPFRPEKRPQLSDLYGD